MVVTFCIARGINFGGERWRLTIVIVGEIGYLWRCHSHGNRVLNRSIGNCISINDTKCIDLYRIIFTKISISGGQNPNT